MKSGIRRIALTIPCLCICAAPAASAATGTAESDAEADRRPWSLQVGVNAGGASSRGYAVGVRYDAAEAGPWTSLNASRADARDASGATQESSSGDVTVGGSLGPARATVGFASTRDDGLRRSRQWQLGIGAGPPEAEATLLVQRRSTDLDAFPVATSISLRSGATVPVNGTATCSFDDTTFGAAVSTSFDAWSAYVSGQHSDFDEPRCTFASAAASRSPSGRQVLDRAALRRIAGPRAIALGPRARGRIGFDQALTENLYAFGIARQGEHLGVAIDASWAQDYATATWQRNVQLTTTVPAGDRWSFDVGVGTTSGGGSDSTYGSVFLKSRF